MKIKPYLGDLWNGLVLSIHLEPKMITNYAFTSLSAFLNPNMSYRIRVMDPKLEFLGLNPDTIPRTLVRLGHYAEVAVVYLKVSMQTKECSPCWVRVSVDCRHRPIGHKTWRAQQSRQSMRASTRLRFQSLRWDLHCNQGGLPAILEEIRNWENGNLRHLVKAETILLWALCGRITICPIVINYFHIIF